MTETRELMTRIGEFSLDGKTAVVTGGSRSIGRAAGVVLGEAGANVVVAGRTTTDLDAVVNEVSDLGAKAVAERATCVRRGTSRRLSMTR